MSGPSPRSLVQRDLVDRYLLDELGACGLGRSNDALVHDDPLHRHRRPARIPRGVAETFDSRRAHEAAGGREQTLARFDHLIEDAHAFEVPLRARNHGIAAKLVAGKLRLVEEQDSDVLLGQVPRTSCAGGSSAHDGDVVEGVGHGGGFIGGGGGDQRLSIAETNALSSSDPHAT